jgi:hypothetical protein
VQKAPGVGVFLSFMGHCVIENRYGLLVASEVTRACGTTQRDSSPRMARMLNGTHQKTGSADKRFEIRDFVADLRISAVTYLGSQNI